MFTLIKLFKHFELICQFNSYNLSFVSIVVNSLKGFNIIYGFWSKFQFCFYSQLNIINSFSDYNYQLEIRYIKLSCFFFLKKNKYIQVEATNNQLPINKKPSPIFKIKRKILFEKLRIEKMPKILDYGQFCYYFEERMIRVKY